MQGYIKLFRKLVDWEWYGDPVVKSVFIDLLINANYKVKQWQGQTVNPGELVTSVSSIAERNGLSVQQVRTALKKLEKTGEINKRSTNKNTLIIVLNYRRYQELSDCEAEDCNKQTTNNQQSNNNQSTTTKKVRSKESKEYITSTTREKLVELYPPEYLTDEWLNTGLTMAEYCYLNEHMSSEAYDKYFYKVQEYSDCKDRFNTILRWAKLDGEFY